MIIPRVSKSFAAITILLLATALFGQSNTWTNIGLGGGGGMYSGVVSPVDHNLLLVSCDMGGKYRSTDGGVTWSMTDWRQIAQNHYCAPAFHPTDVNIIFAAGNKGFSSSALLKSIDKGITWNPCVSGSAPWGTNALGYIYIDRGDPNLMFVGSDTNAYRSTNGGSSWAQCPTIAGKVVGFLVDQGSSAGNRTCFAATTTGGVYRSTDNGATWTAKNSGLPSAAVVSFAGGSTASAITLYCVATSNSDLYKTTDKGDNWVSAMGNLDNSYNYLKVASADNSPDTVYVCNLSNKYLYKTTNAGTNWTEIVDGKVGTSAIELGWLEYAWSWAMHFGWAGALGKEYGLYACSNDANYLFGTNYGESFLTTDGGSTWKEVYSTYADNGAPAIHKKWKSRGLEVTTTWHYYIDPTDSNKHYICYTDIGFARSLDGGATWIHSTEGLNYENTVYDLAFVPETPGTIFAATSNIHDIPGWQYIADPAGGGEVAKSTDYGATWSSSSTGLPVRAATSIVRNPTDKYLYVTMYMDGVYRSTDNGATWAKKSTGLGVGSNMNVYSLKVHADGTLFCLITARRVGSSSFPDAGGLFKSTNKGDSWTNISSMAGVSGPLFYPQEFDVHPTDSQIIYIASTTAPGHAQGGLYRTTNGGGAWSKVVMPVTDAYGCTNGYSTLIDPSTPSTIYYSSSQFGFFTSTNGGVDWIQDPDLPFKNIQRVTIDPANNALYACTFGGGIWKKGGSPLINITVPLTATLNNVKGYPNPCVIKNTIGGLFKITGLPSGSEVFIYDAEGRLLRKVNDAQYGGAGWAGWDGKDDLGQDVPRGMYLYSVVCGSERKTGKIALLK